MTAIWMGITTVASELNAGRLELLGDRSVASSMQKWLGLSPFAKETKRPSKERVGVQFAYAETGAARSASFRP